MLLTKVAEPAGFLVDFRQREDTTDEINKMWDDTGGMTINKMIKGSFNETRPADKLGDKVNKWRHGNNGNENHKNKQDNDFHTKEFIFLCKEKSGNMTKYFSMLKSTQPYSTATVMQLKWE